MVIKFDLSSIPQNAVITGAVLSVYAYDPQESYVNGAQKIYPITRDWSESSVTWNSPWSRSGGDYGSELSTVNANRYNIWEDFTVTSAIKGMVENGDENYGFLIAMSNYTFFAKFRSSEYTDQTLRPKLTITYELGGDEEPPDVTVTSPNGEEVYMEGQEIEITWLAVDNVGVVSCTLFFSDDDGQTWEEITELNGNPGTFLWTLPSIFSQTCKVRVEAADAAGNVGTDDSDLSFAIEPATDIGSNPLYLTPGEIHTATITTVQGRVIARIKTTDLRTIDTMRSSLSKGVYIVTIKSGDTKVAAKSWLIQ